MIDAVPSTTYNPLGSSPVQVDNLNPAIEYPRVTGFVKCSVCGRYSPGGRAVCINCGASLLTAHFASMEEYQPDKFRFIDADADFFPADHPLRRYCDIGITEDINTTRISTMDVLNQGPVSLLKQNRNWLCLVCGPTGTGKTYTAIRLAELLDKNFTVDKIAFTTLELVRLFKECGKGDFIVYDEAQEWNARTSQGKANIILSKIIAMLRFTQINVIFTLPHMDMIDINARRLCHNYIYSIQVDRTRDRKKANKSGVWWYDIRSSRIPMDGKGINLSYSFPTVKGERVGKVWFEKADDNLLKAYEAKKASRWKVALKNFEQELVMESEYVPARMRKGQPGQQQGLPGQEPASALPQVTNAAQTLKRFGLPSTDSIMKKIIGG